jgi:flagellar biosynthesis/type III secretory pathway M-ring protein FliF/YscJ
MNLFMDALNVLKVLFVLIMFWHLLHDYIVKIVNSIKNAEKYEHEEFVSSFNKKNTAKPSVYRGN